MIPFDWPGTEGQPGGSRLLDRILDRLQLSLKSLVRAVTNDHLIVVTLGATPIRVIHGLEGPPVAWEIVGRDAAETVFEATITNDERSKFLYLQASGAVTVTVRFS